MRYLKFIVIFLVAIFCIAPCYAQYDEYYKVDDDTYVTTVSNASLYELPNYVNNTSSKSSVIRDIVDVNSLKTKLVKKPHNLRVVRYTNTIKSSDFNAYIVEYKDKLCVLQCCDVQDNSAINSRNDIILDDKIKLDIKYHLLKSRSDSVNNQIILLDSVYKVEFKKECVDSINYYKNRKVELVHDRDSIIQELRKQEQVKIDKIYNEWYNTLPISTKKAADAIHISKSMLCPPNYAGGCDYYLNYKNNSKKTIKYLDWNGIVYNAVNDRVNCEINGNTIFSGKDTGPILPGENGGGCWSCIIYNFSADTIKLNNIYITYMDGSSINITGADIKRLMTVPEISVVINVQKITDKYGLEDEICDVKMKKWQKHMKMQRPNDAIPMCADTTWEQLKTIRASLDKMKLEAYDTRKEMEMLEKFINWE